MEVLLTPSARRRFLLVLAVVVLAALGWIVFCVQRPSGSKLLGAGGRREPAPSAPVELEASAGRRSDATATMGPEKTGVGSNAPPADPNVAVLEGTLVRAEDRSVLPGVKLSLNFRAGNDGGKNVTAETDVEGRFVIRLATSTALPLHGAWFEQSDLWEREFVLDDPERTADRVKALPGETVRFTLLAAEARQWRGIVVDEEGRPLRDIDIMAFLPGPGDGSQGSGMGSQTDASGHFQVTTLANPDQVTSANVAPAAARLRFTTSSRPPVVVDVRKLTEADRAELRVVMGKGRRIVGRLVDEFGRALEKQLVTAGSATPGATRVAFTDGAGAFALTAVPDGPVRIGSFVADRDLEARQDLTLSSDLLDLVLVARPVDLLGPPVVAMGLRLGDVSDELRKEYGLHSQVKVVVLDPGVVGSLFGGFGGDLQSGTGIRMIGDRAVTSVKDLIERIIAEYEETQRTGPAKSPIDLRHGGMIRIVTAYRGGGGTFTSFFGVDERTVDHLRRLLRSLR